MGLCLFCPSLGQIQGYDASQIGAVLIWLGSPQLVIIPVVPKLMKHIDSRIIIGTGVLLFGGRSFFTVHLDTNFAGPQFYAPLIIRAFGQPLITVPLSAVTTAGMAKGRESGAAPALFNMMRNIGGWIGIAVLSTLLSLRERSHSERIGESGDSLFRRSPGASAAGSGLPPISRKRPLFSSHPRDRRRRRREAFMQAYSDCFQRVHQPRLRRIEIQQQTLPPLVTFIAYRQGYWRPQSY